MRSMRKYTVFLLTLACLSTCDSHESASPIPRTPCEVLLDKLEECIGGRPALRGVGCSEEKANALLDLTCDEILSELMGG